MLIFVSKLLGMFVVDENECQYGWCANNNKGRLHLHLPPIDFIKKAWKLARLQRAYNKAVTR